ncbi:MAG: tetratricopeptide repeat protein [Bacteroidia bacterium]
MKSLKSYILIGILCIGHSSYAQSERGFLKRGWDNMIARYNIYFNATTKFDAATANLFEGHKDDFETFLDVYPYGSLEDAKSMRAPMEEVMKKASKVIQNKPKSKWVDDSYFLIGQTHFFKNDQYAAIEAFQFVYSKYSDPYMKAKSQLWVMKSYLRQEKYNDAEAVLSFIRDAGYPDKSLKAHTHLTAGDLYVKQGKYELAIEELTQGVKLIKDKTLRYRTHFILGQLHLEQENYELANEHFLKVIKANSPYDYVFHANLGLTKATARSGGKGIKSTKKSLKRMLNDDKNIDYFDQIYYELALLEFVEGNEDQGIKYLMESSSNAGSNSVQKTKTYLFLADYFFNTKEYKKSQAYFDSAVSVLPSGYPDYDGITAKHAVLSKLIENIQQIEHQDSLLKLAAMPREQLDKHIDDIIKEQERLARIAADEEQMRQDRALMNPGSSIGTTSATAGGIWYFYNASQVGRGANEFTKIWGKRKLGDWWRFKNKSVSEQAEPEPDPDDDDDDNPISYNPDDDQDQLDALESVSEDRIKYYENIPFSDAAKEIAHRRIQGSLLDVGKIYFDELKEYLKSKEYLLSLLERYPETEHKPEGIFYLAKVERELGDTSAYDRYALQIANEYPNTAYNQVLNSKEIAEDGESEEVLNLYGNMYDAYLANNHEDVEAIHLKVGQEHAGNSIQAKFDYLYALHIGKTKGKDAYIVELQALVDNYPGTEIATQAAYTIRFLGGPGSSSDVDISMYSVDMSGGHYFVITGRARDLDDTKEVLDEYNSKFYPSTTIQIKSLEFEGKQLLYLKPFGSVEQVMAYRNDIAGDLSFLEKSGLSEIEIYPISEPNFRILLSEQNESVYLVFYQKNYPIGL